MNQQTPTVTAALIRHLGRCGAGDTDCPSLTAAQWAALRFFAGANRLTRTPSAFASFHGSTRGTASQTIKSLVRMGYLDRQPDPGDRRRLIFKLTASGWQALEHDPAASLERAIEALSADEHARLASAIQALVATIDNDSHPRFGCCDGCHFCTLDDRTAGSAHCTVTGEPIHDRDRHSLCVAYSPGPVEVDNASDPRGAG